MIKITIDNIKGAAMKKTLYLALTATLVTILFTSCVTQETSRKEYFGYNNSPKIPKQETKTKQTTKWQNPLSNSNSNYNTIETDSYIDNEQQSNIVYYTPSVETRYVPVIVPWWDTYYGCYSSHWGYRRHWDYYWWSYDWYSPWYYHHPYYGYNWAYYGPHYNGWYPYHYYAGSPRNTQDNRKMRNFGPSRGTITNNSSYSSATPSRTNVRRNASVQSSSVINSTNPRYNNSDNTANRNTNIRRSTTPSVNTNTNTNTNSNSNTKSTNPRYNNTNDRRSSTRESTQERNPRYSSPSSGSSSSPSRGSSSPSSSGGSSSGSSGSSSGGNSGGSSRPSNPRR